MSPATIGKFVHEACPDAWLQAGMVARLPLWITGCALEPVSNQLHWARGSLAQAAGEAAAGVRTGSCKSGSLGVAGVLEPSSRSRLTIFALPGCSGSALSTRSSAGCKPTACMLPGRALVA